MRTFRQTSSWLSCFAWFTAGATVFLICSGGMVTSKGVGLAVPDWPTTFGYNMFLFPISRWFGGIFFEHTHRLIASAVGFLTIILAIWLCRADPRRWVRNLGLAAIGAVILQGLLGGLRVTMLKDQIGIFHACLAQSFLGLLVLIALVTSHSWRAAAIIHLDRKNGPTMLRLAVVTSVVIFVQLALGATMRHQHRDLAILDFPTANGAWIPDTSANALAAVNAWRDSRGLSDVTAFQIWLQMLHRFGAVLVAVGVITFWIRVRKYTTELPYLRGLSSLWLLVLVCQISLGAWTIWSNKAADVATAHVAFGALMFAIATAMVALCWRMSRSANDPQMLASRVQTSATAAR